MDTITLSAATRTTETKAREVRENGRIPCVLYGFEVENTTMDCDYQEFHRTYVAAGESTVIDLTVNDKTVPVLVQSIDLDPVTNEYTHVDFFAIDMNKQVTTPVPFKFEGESPAIKNLGCMLVHNRDHVNVTCLPKNLLHHITINLSELTEPNQIVTVADLIVPDTVTIDENPETTVVTIQPPRKSGGGGSSEEAAEEEGDSASEDGEEEKKEEK